MTPAEHYTEAERWMKTADEQEDGQSAELALKYAQVHATLATVHEELGPWIEAQQ